MTETYFEIEGIESLIDILATKYPRELKGTFVQAIQIAALLVVRYARQNSPVDTGRLRASIVAEVIEDVWSVEGIIGTPVEYASAVEEPGGVRGVGMRPYLLPALEDNIQQIIGIYIQHLEKLGKRLGL